MTSYGLWDVDPHMQAATPHGGRWDSATPTDLDRARLFTPRDLKSPWVAGDLGVVPRSPTRHK